MAARGDQKGEGTWQEGACTYCISHTASSGRPSPTPSKARLARVGPRRTSSPTSELDIGHST